eukprot:228953-Chlamydomonas_euryale.AAC.1
MGPLTCRGGGAPYLAFAFPTSFLHALHSCAHTPFLLPTPPFLHPHTLLLRPPSASHPSILMLADLPWAGSIHIGTPRPPLSLLALFLHSLFPHARYPESSSLPPYPSRLLCPLPSPPPTKTHLTTPPPAPPPGHPVQHRDGQRGRAVPLHEPRGRRLLHPLGDAPAAGGAAAVRPRPHGVPLRLFPRQGCHRWRSVLAVPD